MALPPKLEDCDRVLIVEGYTDLLFYAELIEAVGKNGKVFIKHFNGRADLATKLDTFVTPQLLLAKEAFGIIVDADDNAQRTVSELARLLEQITNQAVTQGAWTSGRPRIGFFVTPDGNSNGEIETLVWRAWSADPRNAHPKQCITEFVACMAVA